MTLSTPVIREETFQFRMNFLDFCGIDYFSERTGGDIRYECAHLTVSSLGVTIIYPTNISHCIVVELFLEICASYQTKNVSIFGCNLLHPC